MRVRRSIGLPIVLLMTFATVIAAPVHARTSVRDKPIYFIHGINTSGYADCAMWDPMSAQFDKWLKVPARAPGVRNPKHRTVRYYFQDANCATDVSAGGSHAVHTGPPQSLQGTQPHRQGSHTSATPIAHLAYHLAWSIYDNHSQRGEAIDIVAHSMGGLLTRYALAAVALGHPDFPKFLLVEDVVTLGTPHGGARGPYPSVQGAEMKPGSSFLKSLQRVRRPEGKGGTDWLTIGSDDDTAVASDRAVGTDRDRDPTNKYFDSQHKVWYTTVNNIEHSDYYKIKATETAGGAVAYQSLAGSPFLSRPTAMTWPVRRTWLSLMSGKT